MRIAAIFDIHGNLPALEAVLDEVHRAEVDCMIVGGDVFPGPMPARNAGLLARMSYPGADSFTATATARYSPN